MIVVLLLVVAVILVVVGLAAGEAVWSAVALVVAVAAGLLIARSVLRERSGAFAPAIPSVEPDGSSRSGEPPAGRASVDAPAEPEPEPEPDGLEAADEDMTVDPDPTPVPDSDDDPQEGGRAPGEAVRDVSQPSTDDLVQVVPGRRRYHRGACTLLDEQESETITLAEARGEQFSACSRCVVRSG